MTTVRDAVLAVYAQVRAPDWAAPNLDGLADVLRDLSWLPRGPVSISVADAAPERVRRVLDRAAAETAGTDRPVLVRPPGSRGPS